MLQDIRFGFRLIGRQPGFTAAAVLTLGLGVGANAAIFAVAWHLMLKPLPVENSQQLVRVWETYDGQSINPVAPAFYHDWLGQSQAFTALAAYTYFEDRVSLTGAGEPEQLTLRSVTGDYFRVVGMAPLHGRVLDDRDARSDELTVVLSEGLWRRRFGADADVVGRVVRIKGQAATVVGVMPDAFGVVVGRSDLWSGLGFSPSQVTMGMAHYLAVIGRLKDGVSLEQAASDVKAISARTVPRFPQLNQKLSALVQSIDGSRAGVFKSGIQSLMGAAAFVLLIACANLASLQLARGVARGREFGIRAALGASRGRLIRQLLIEGLVLSVLGAATGLLLSRWILSGLAAIAPPSLRYAASAGPDGWIMAYTLALATVCAVLFALAPAWRTASRAVTWLRQQVTTGDRAATLARASLVTAQVALAVILLVGASLLITSLSRVLRVDPGFDAAGVMAFDLSLPASKFESDGQRLAFIDRMLGELRALPGVTSACAINQIPFDAEGNMTYVPDGQTRMVSALPRTMTPECFDVLKIRLIRGRLFDAREPHRVGVVTERFAASAWPDQDPIGRRVHLGLPDGALIEIIGVVADSRQQSLEARPFPQFYELSAAETPFPASRVLLRANTPLSGSLFAAVRAAVRRVDPDQPVARLRTLADVVATTTSSRRFNLTLLGSFAILALLLSAIGLYGLLAEVVSQRQREIGIRLALGASGRSVVRLMMTRAWIAIAIGLAVGVTGASFASKLLQQQLFGISPTDIRTYVGVAVLLAAVGLVAAWLPARRAAGVHPVTALRQ